MHSVTEHDLLAVWERALSQPPVQRALTLLSAEGPGDDPARLSVGTRNVRLLRLREQIFGSQLHGLTTCPECAQELELHFATTDLLSDAIPAKVSGRCGEYHLRLRPPSGEDLVALAGESDAGRGRRALFRRCLLEARRGERLVGAEEMPDDLIVWAAARLAEADPNADMRLALNCPQCGYGWRAAFDVAAFFWKELHAWARGLLRDIHTLARAYGWREADVLALSPARRQAYLDLVNE
jgi:hypothetical protein